MSSNYAHTVELPNFIFYFIMFKNTVRFVRFVYVVAVLYKMTTETNHQYNQQCCWINWGQLRIWHFHFAFKQNKSPLTRQVGCFFCFLSGRGKSAVTDDCRSLTSLQMITESDWKTENQNQGRETSRLCLKILWLAYLGRNDGNHGLAVVTVMMFSVWAGSSLGFETQPV